MSTTMYTKPGVRCSQTVLYAARWLTAQHASVYGAYKDEFHNNEANPMHLKGALGEMAEKKAGRNISFILFEARQRKGSQPSRSAAHRKATSMCQQQHTNQVPGFVEAHADFGKERVRERCE